MRAIQEHSKSITVSGRIPELLHVDLKEYTENNDMSMSELVQEALYFLMYCLDNEEEDSDIKDVLDTYYNVDDDDDDDDDDEDEDDYDEDEDEADEDDEEAPDDDEAADEDK